GRLLLIGGRLLLIEPALRIGLAAVGPATEQKFDEAATHPRPLGVGRAHRLRLTRVDHGGFGDGSIDRRTGIETDTKEGGAGKQRSRQLSEHRRTLYWFRLVRPRALPPPAYG